MNMKKYIFLAASALALASCSSDDLLSDTPGNTPTSANSAINFGGDAGKITRTTQNSGTAAQMLDGQFKIYGVKKTNDEILHNVFVNYYVWDVENKNTTTSNKDGWEYVGDKGAKNLGTGNIELDKDQTIKYWDYSASEYHFVAGSPIKAFTYNINKMDSENGTEITSATISGLAGHIDKNETGTALDTYPVYVAEPKKVEKKDYKEPVQFTFVRQQAMVRVGIYETIPGYSITNIKFYEADGTSATGNNIILTSATEGYFIGGTNVSGTVTYDWTTATPSYTFAYTDNTNLKKSKNWYAGKLGALENKSTAEVGLLYGTDKDMSTTGYFTVLPTPLETKASAILIKCDYELTSDDGSGETINVKGATAAIPAAFSKWETNTRYTYLFKISDKTNGTTGDPEKNDPAGLYPITFNAAVTESKQGTITTFTTPSITTKQDGSVDENSGIKYVINKPITVKVTKSDEGSELDLTSTENTNGYTVVYKFTDPITEAEAQVKGIEAGEKFTKIYLDPAKKLFTFIPDTEGYYVIQYLTIKENSSKVYTYKVVKVEAAPATK